MARFTVNRRRFLTGAALGTGSLLLSGCDAIGQNPTARNLLQRAETLTEAVQRALLDRDALAPEFSESEIIQPMRPNGTTAPREPEYRTLAASGFADWRLQVGGLVERPAEFSLDELRAMPSRTQITRHDCVEGWSCSGKWKGVPLGAVLERVGLKPQARYVAFSCADTLEQTFDGTGQYYESIGLEDAFHPQTILAYDMNDQTLPIPHGAPLRVRIERQLGYKMAKYIMRIDAVESLEGLGGGKGGFWEDRGYEWYAGI